jgi:hypothetical protein
MGGRSLLGLLAIAGLLYAQADRANLNGTVMDPSGLPVNGAVIEVLFADTGLSRMAKSSDAGTYAIAALPVGNCRVTVRAGGFQSRQVDRLLLTVGETRTLDVQLGIETVSDAVEVQAAPPPVERSSAAIGDVIEGAQVEKLPLNGRNWATLMILSTGAIDTGTGNQISIRFAGHGLDDNKLQLDGVDATGILRQSQKTDLRLQISTESIGEFRVNSALYAAEYGGVGGGQIDVVSRTGTNEWHGALLQYLRNDIFDARSPFDPATLPPFRLNQFGGSVGGPIARNRSFVFLNYEGLRQTLGQTLTGFVPDNSFRSAVMAQSPQLQPLLNAYPTVTARTANADIDVWTGQGRQVQNENSGLFRFDHNFTDKTTGFVRWNIDAAALSAPLGDSSGFLRDTRKTDDQPQNGELELSHVFSSTLLNETRAGVNRVPFTMGNNSFVPQALQVSGFTSLNDNLTQVQNATTYSVGDHATFLRKRHSVKVGVELRRVQINLGNTQETIYSFTSLPNFAGDRLGEADLLAAVPTSGVRKTEYSGFVQDEFKVKPNITLNLGLRYEYFGVFSEVKGRARPFDPETCGGFCPAGASFYHPDRADFGPRVGITWAPRLFGKLSNKQTVFRIGSGLYYGEAQLGDLTGPLNNLTSRITLTSVNIPQLSYPPDPFVSLGQSVGNQPRALDRDRKNQRIAQWGFTVQQELPLRTLLEVGYMGNKGTHIFGRTYANAIDPETGQRPLPAFALVDYKRMDRNSDFNAFVAALHRRFHSGWLLSANYMWSHAIDDGSVGGGESDYPENIACQRCERASSDQDIRHNFTASAVYKLPFGLEFSGIGTARTGLPLTVTVSRNAADLPDGNNNSQRPNLLPGVSLIPPGGQTPGLWINPAAFVMPASETWGNAGRNLARAPGIWQADISLTKRTRLTDHANLEFRAEAYNIFNRAQYGAPATNLSAAGSFGRITQPLNPGATGTGTPRQIQLALRLRF